MDDRELSRIMMIVSERLLGYGETLSQEQIAIWDRAFSRTRYTAEIVEAAFDAHESDPEIGHFAPDRPSRIIGQVRKWLMRKWPTPDEAWATINRSRDESETVFWPIEVAEASGGDVASLLDSGDMVAARRAFIDAYTKRRDEAIEMGRLPTFHISPGTDQVRREIAAKEALRLGWIDEKQMLQYQAPKALTAGGKEIAGLLTDQRQTLTPEQARCRAEEIKQRYFRDSKGARCD